MKEASKVSRTVNILDLSYGGTTGDALTCKNMMCGKLGDPCVCRLAQYIFLQGYVYSEFLYNVMGMEGVRNETKNK